MRNQKGVTLIELMVALTVASILLGAAIPSFQQTIINSRLSSAANELNSSINYIRSEAVRLGKSVKLCKNNGGTTCSTTTSVYWEKGWIALDSDGNLLRTWPELSSGVTLRACCNTPSSSPPSHIENYVIYNPMGATNDIGTFAVCHDSNESGAKALVITRVRPRMGNDSDLSSCESP
jgi:type IV fimbrial biogenesis protein FimT